MDSSGFPSPCMCCGGTSWEKDHPDGFELQRQRRISGYCLSKSPTTNPAAYYAISVEIQSVGMIFKL